MDRWSANRDLTAALRVAALAVFIFGMTFVLAIFYIA
jgi:hypothetical protein